MLALERQSIVMELAKQEGRVYVSTLAKRFDVSLETIRRDLDKLEADGLIIKTYGGALYKNPHNIDIPFNIRNTINTEAKEKIALTLANLIKDGDQIMVDASSTSIYCIRQIKNIKKNITIITNSIEIMVELADKEGWNILSTGGSLRVGAYSLNGSNAEKMIKDHHVDIALCSAKGLDNKMGITESNEKDAEIKKAYFSSANKRILVLDHSKFNNIAFIKVCDLKDIDILITDEYPDESMQEYIRNNNVELLVYGGEYESFSN